MTAPLTIAIDGPSGSGKSSVSRAVARRLGVGYLDTGAMYRALTWWCLERGHRPHRHGCRGRRRARPPARDRHRPRRARPCRWAAPTSARRSARPGEHRRLRGRDQPRGARGAAAAAARPDGPGRRARPGEWWPRAATSPRSSPPTPACGCCSRPPRRPGCAAARPSCTAPSTTASVEATRDQVVRRDRDDSTVSTFTEAAEGVVLVDTSDLDFDESVEAVLDVVARRDGGVSTARRLVTKHLAGEGQWCGSSTEDPMTQTRGPRAPSSARCGPGWRTSSSATRTAPCSSAATTRSTPRPATARCPSSPSSAARTSASRPW